MMTIVDPLCCGFGKIVMYQLSVESCTSVSKSSSVVNVSGVLRKEFEQFVSIFEEGTNFDIEYEWYRRNVSKIKESIQRLGRLSSANKNKVVGCFSREKWLSVDAKSNHSLFNCQECLGKYHECLSLFLIGVKDPVRIKRAKEAGLFKEKASVVRKEAKERLSELNEEYQEKFDCSFEEAAFGLRKFEKKKERTALLKKVKYDIESQWKKTSILRLVIYILVQPDYVLQYQPIKKMSLVIDDSFQSLFYSFKYTFYFLF